MRVKKSILYLLASFVPLLTVVLYALGQLFVTYSSKDSFKNLLVLSTENVNDYYMPSLAWKLPIANEGRPTDLNGIVKIGQDYVASYFHQFQAFQSGETKGLEDFFTKEAREKILAQVSWYQSQDQKVAGTTISHQASLDFFSADGTIANLTDRVISYQNITDQEKTQYSFYDTSTYQVMLMLEDNFWRIRQKIKIENTQKAYTPILKKHPNPLVDQLKGINYYPKQFPWRAMWEEFDQIDFEADFQKISGAGFNTLRIFIPYDHFGGAHVKPNELQNLLQLLDLAQKKKLKVIITLFDFFLGYQIQEWTQADRHLEAIVKAVGNHPAVLAFDLKNEPDLDFKNHGQEQVLAWLKFISNRLSTYQPTASKTIGWSQPEYLRLLQTELNFLSFHFYRDPDELKQFLTNNTFEKPLFLGEFGKHSFDKWWYPFSSSEEQQAAYYQEILNIVARHELHFAAWTLYDFEKIPSDVAGKYPWQKGPQKAYGLLSGVNEKKSFELIKKHNFTTHEK